MDPLVGLAGTAVIASWAWGLLRPAGRVLVDAVPEARPIEAAVRERLERDGDRMTDLHLWQIGPGHLACVVALVSDTLRSASAYKARLTDISGLSHITVEVEVCPATIRPCAGPLNMPVLHLVPAASARSQPLCVHQIQMSPSVPVTDVTASGRIA
jgi:hypothetical protein